MYRLLIALTALAVASAAAGQDLPGTLKKIRDSKTITLGYRDNSVPFSFTGPDKQPDGYTVDLCKRVVASLQRQLNLPDIQVRWVQVTAESRIPAVTKGEIDLECGTTTATLGRQEQVDFSNLTFVDGGGFLIRSDTKIAGMGNLAGKKIAVTAGTTTEKQLRDVLKERLVNAEVVTVKSEIEALAALEAGRIDAYANDRIVLVGLATQAKDPKSLMLLEEDFSFEPYALMMRRDPAFRLAVNRALSQIYRSGAIVEIYDRWFGQIGKPGVLLAAMYYLNAVPE